MKCPACGMTIDTTNVLKTAKEAHALYLSAQQQPSNRMQHLSKSLKLAEQCFFEWNTHISEIRDCLAKELASRDQFDESAEMVFANYKITSLRFGRDSIEAASELMKLAGLWSRIPGKENKSFTACRHATTILNIFQFVKGEVQV